ncbi:hypothetical protein TNCV_2507881 [Trichonephila clavipes]|nr:hypothetical protein TNCV_2507881 [Trichonephila clavipes]
MQPIPSVFFISPNRARNKDDLPLLVSPTTAIKDPSGMRRFRYFRLGMSSPSQQKEALVSSTLFPRMVSDYVRNHDLQKRING